MNSQLTQPEKSPATSFGRLVTWLIRGIQLSCECCALLGYLLIVFCLISSWHPYFDLATHTSWHAFLALSVVGMTLFLGRFFSSPETRSRWSRYLLLWFVPWLFLVWRTAPWESLALKPNNSEAKGLKILSWNIWLRNRELEEVSRFVKKENADIVVLIELATHQMAILETLQKDYPYSTWAPDGAAGIAVLSRVPDTQFETIRLGGHDMPAIDASVPETKHSQAMRLLAVHTLSPSHRSYRTVTRDQQLKAAGEWVRQTKQPSVVIGDLNISPWSAKFWKLLDEGQLRDSRAYRGNLASWPSLLGDLGIPIDHALVTDELEILYRDVEKSMDSSDHRPIRLIVR